MGIDMELKMNVKDLKDITNLLLTLVTEAKFEFTDKGLSVKCVDAAHVAMIVINSNKEAFLEYNVENEVSVGLDLDKVKDFLKLANINDVVSIKKEDSKITFSIGNLTRSMSTIDPSNMTVPKIPTLGLPAKVTIPTPQFEGGIKAAETISDNITLRLTPSEFEMYTSGDDDYSKLVMPQDMLKDLSCESEVRSLYPIEYLLKFVRAVDFSEYLIINLGTDYPVKIEFSFKENLGNGLFLLAPRIEGD